jgi:hypothetical protein
MMFFGSNKASIMILNLQNNMELCMLKKYHIVLFLSTFCCCQSLYLVFATPVVLDMRYFCCLDVRKKDIQCDNDA